MSDKPVSGFMHLIKETITSTSDKHIGKIFKEDLDRFSKIRLAPLWQLDKNAEMNPYVISLVGLTNVGKSTLTEALLGHAVAPHKNQRATAIPVEYKYSLNWQMEVMTHHDFKYKEYDYDDPSLLAKELTKYVFDVDTTNAYSVEYVKVKGPMEVLKEGLILADTPGFGAAQQVGDGIRRNQDHLEGFIKNVHRVYLCLSVGADGDTFTVSDDEKAFFQRIKSRCSNIIVNKWKFDEDHNQQEYINKYNHIFENIEEDGFIFINAKNAIKGKEKSNIEKLKSDIVKYSTPEQRRCVVWNDLVRAWKDCQHYMETVHHLSEIPWRPDSLKRFLLSCKSVEKLHPIVSDIERIIK